MSQNFENIVKNAFENFEADVSPQAWTNIQNGLQASAPVNHNPVPDPGTVITKTTGWLSQVGTIITAGTVTVLTMTSIWYFSGKDKQVATPQNIKRTEEIRQSPDQIITPSANNQEVKSTPENETITGTGNSIPVSQREKNTNSSQQSATGFQSPADQAKNNVNQSKTIAENDNAVTCKNDNFGNKSVTEHEANAATAPAQKEVKELIQSYQEEPIAYILANPVAGSAPLTVNFLNNGYANEVTWDFGNETVKQNQVTHVFQTPGSYKVTLTAKDSEGNVVTDNIIILVKEPENGQSSSIGDIQNVFTPNGDGYNDIFKIRSKNISSFNALIFNANGRKVYQWTDPESGWDGKMGGAHNADEGAYYYIIEAKGTDGKVYQFKGSLRLIR